MLAAFWKYKTDYKIYTMQIHYQFILFFWLILISACNGQENQKAKIREPAYAGKFYKANPVQLREQLEGFFAKAPSKKHGVTRALVSPHAGYVFSGEVAASAFRQIKPGRQIKNVFLIGSAHKVPVKVASVYNGAYYKTPLGKVAVNQKITNQLLKQKSRFRFNEPAHLKEHSLEVQLPFLQYHLQHSFKIVPILINTKNEKHLQNLADDLNQYYTKDNLFVLSTDFSHYPKYEDACRIDSLTASALATGDPKRLLMQIQQNRESGVSQLKTSMCGLSAMIVMMHIAEQHEHEIHKIQYQNSAASPYGDKKRVVGYWSMRITDNDQNKNKNNNSSEFSLSTDEKQTLLTIARETISTYLQTGKLPSLKTYQITPQLKTQTGCFVTLNKNKRLRGCIGNFSGKLPLAEGVQEMAVAAATEDNRFQKVEPEELPEIDIEISVLTPLQKISSLDEFKMGKHGIYIKKGMRTGTYLPQVADGVDWTKKEFVEHCAQNKAGLQPGEWKKADLYTYKALIFSEKNLTHD